METPKRSPFYLVFFILPLLINILWLAVLYFLVSRFLIGRGAVKINELIGIFVFVTTIILVPFGGIFISRYLILRNSGNLETKIDKPFPGSFFSNFSILSVVLYFLTMGLFILFRFGCG